jgi:hypothetical protein
VEVGDDQLIMVQVLPLSLMIMDDQLLVGHLFHYQTNNQTTNFSFVLQNDDESNDFSDMILPRMG